MSLTLAEELTQKQAPKFQVNNIGDAITVGSTKFIGEVIKQSSEGILNLDSKIDEESVMFFMDYLKTRYNGNPWDKYEFELNHNPSTNSEIFFRKKEVKN
jgi:DNA-directed RNA polymerase sigma subunit (sigma70/sigma32)